MRRSAREPDQCSKQGREKSLDRPLKRKKEKTPSTNETTSQKKKAETMRIGEKKRRGTLHNRFKGKDRLFDPRPGKRKYRVS